MTKTQLSKWAVLAAAIALAMTSGCGSPGGNDGGSGGGSGACNTLVNDGAGIPESAGSGSIPAMTGGTIADGTWVLSERLDYSGGTCGCITHIKVKIAAGAIEVISRTDPNADQKMSGTITSSGNTTSWNFTCPATNTLTLQYTATATTLVTLDNQQQVQTFTRQ